MHLTKAQLAHAMLRLNQATEKRVAEATRHIGEKPAVPKLTFDQQFALISAGKAKLKPRSAVSSYTDLNDAYTYPSHEKEVGVASKKVATWEAARNKIIDRIHAERDRVVDQIMLGEANDALVAIDKFAAGKGARA